MSANDDKIKELLAAIEKKKAEIGDKPKAAWKTNGLVGDAKQNINTISLIETCVDIAAQLIQKQDCRKRAATLLGVEKVYNEDNNLADQLDDLKLRVTMLKWTVEKAKLTTLEEKLKDLRSIDAKTADAIAELSSLM
jgi:hypothetical protein